MNIIDTILIFTTLAFKNIFIENFSIWLAGTLAAQEYNAIILTLEDFTASSLEQNQIKPSTIKICVFILPEYDNKVPDLSQSFISIISIQNFSTAKYKLITIKITNATAQHNTKIHNLLFTYPIDKLDSLLANPIGTNRIQIQESIDGTMYQFFQHFYTKIDTIIQNIIN